MKKPDFKIKIKKKEKKADESQAKARRFSLSHVDKDSPIEMTGLVFIILLALVFIGNIVLPDSKFSADENRVFQQFPKLSPMTYIEGRFESKLDDYASDQFMFRKAFIKIKTSSDQAVGKLESNGVYKCRDHYLMEQIEAPDKSQLRKDERLLKLFKRQYPNVDMYFLLAPNAASIYSDKLPLTVAMNDQDYYMNNFFKSVVKAGITPIDVRQTFINNKKKTQLYYRTDHHWTSEGAYLAYKNASSVMGLKDDTEYKPYIVSNDFKGTLYSKSGFTNGRDDKISVYLPTSSGYKNSVIYYSDTKEKTTEFYKLKNLKKKDAYTVFGGSNHPFYTITTPIKSKKNLLIIKDSYANSMIPFFTQSYRKVVVVDPRYYFDDINTVMKANNITDVLFLYNGNTFFTDTALAMMLS
ncbi:MAG: DHHW family protein [Eubacteriales bacterium]|nr:DHHW family protein [Eubacteriales bacterium]